MAELYIFSQDDELLTIITESTGLISAPFHDEVNSVASEPFTFTVDADVERAKYVKEENRVVFKDKDGFFREMVIKELDDIDNMDGPQTTAICLPAWLDELSEHYVLDKRYQNKESQLALDDALAGTRYIGEVEASLGLASTNFYRLSSVDCIWEILKVWGGDFRDTVEFTGNKITTRKILLLQRLGSDKGARFEIDHNIEQIQRTVLSYPKTAMYGWGASLETDGGGHTRYIDFADVEWKVSNGDPVDKPKGQKWVGDPDALLKYGRKHKGQLLHRFAEFSNQDYEDPEELLWATWLNLQDNKEPVVNYKLSVDLLDKDASLGDGAVAIDREFARPIEIQTRVIAIEYDLLDIEGTAIVEMGQFLNLGDDDIYREIEDLKVQINKPSKPIDNESFPDIQPGIPSNVMAVGGFQQIQLYWDYDSEVYISHYEVYGSQINGFIPDSQHLLYRGRVSSFVHEVDTDETWYYRVRAVNRRGTASDCSAQVSAASVRINTPDIMFGSVTADLLANQLDIAEKLSQNTIDSINAGPMGEIVRTQQEIEATENRLINQLNSEIGDVNASIGSLNDIASNLIARANNTDDLLAQHGGKFTSMETDIDTIENRLTASITSVERIDDTVNAHSATLLAQADLINAKLDSLIYQTDKQGLINSIEANATEIDLLATGLELRVTKEEFDALSVGGRNLLLDTDKLRPMSGSGSPVFEYLNDFMGEKNVVKITNPGSYVIFSAAERYSEAYQKGKEYTFSIKVMCEGVHGAQPKMHLGNYSNSYQKMIGDITETEFNVLTRTAKFSETTTGRVHIDFRGFQTIYLSMKMKVEKGNKATDWTPAPEDTEAEITSVSNRVSTTETTLDVHAGWINAKAEKSELLNYVDKQIYNNKMTALDLSIDGLTTTVSNTQSTVNGLTGQMSSALSQIAEVDIKANGIITSVSEVRSDLNKRTTVQDTRNDNQPPSWYWSNYPRQVVEEFKFRTAIGAPGSITYGNLTTYVYWSNNSGGPIKQEFRSSNGLYERQSVSTTGWTVWREIEDVTGSQAKVNTAVTTLNASISTLAGQIELKASQTSVNSLTNRMSTAEGTLSVLPDQINAKVDKNGVIAQINLSSEGVRIDGNKHHITGQTLIDNGVIGTAAIADAAIKRAHLQNAIIQNAHIADATIEHTKMKSLNVDHVVAGQMDLVYLKAGTIDTDKFTVRGGSSIDYTEISGSTLRARGRFTRTWRGATETHDIVTQLHNGYLRFGNAARDRALNIADFGISTFADGSGDGSGERSSGTIEFFSRRFNSNYHGLTLYSSSVLGIDADKFRVMSQFDVEIESDNAIRFRPGLTMPGNNTFRLTTSGGNTASDIDGYFLYGSENDPHASGLRFSKRMSDPKLEVVDYKFETGGNTSIEAGFGYFNTVRRRSGNSYINIQHADIMQVGSDSNGDRIAMGGAYKRTYSSGANMHITEFGTVGRSTSARKYKRDIEPIDLSVAEKFYELAEPVFYRPQNTADDHMNYSYYGYIADDIAMIEPRLVTYNKEGEPEGFNYDRVPVLLHAVMRDKFRTLENNLSMLELKNQYLTQIIKQQDIRIKQLEEKIA